jgi:LuxR family maltose regulon positive regulatory protein
VHASFGFLLGHLPRSLRLVVASRVDPPLPLARLRAGGRLGELRAADLRFSADEAAHLLREVAGADLPEAAVAALAERTEGWAAGLQLAALSLAGRSDREGFVATFSGSHRYVLDYLAEEVLDRQPEQLRSFLLATSVLQRLSGPLCEAVTGRADSQVLLEAVERANLFLLPMDEAAGGATTGCSPICCAPACSGSSPSGWRGCTGPRPAGTRSMGSSTTRSVMPSPPARPAGPPA